ncbi:MAG: permease prefix domain 2-containing transporter [Stellaceae bacterium]
MSKIAEIRAKLDKLPTSFAPRRKQRANKLKTRARNIGGVQLSGPPDGAKFLLHLLLTKHDREAIPGDLEEEFATDFFDLGPKRARILYWKRAISTIAYGNPVCRWLLTVGIYEICEWVRRKIAS